MSAIRSRDTGPERTVRKLAHSLGYRYRLHVASLPGTPDLVFPSRKKVIFVHGCFGIHMRNAAVSKHRTHIDFQGIKFRSQFRFTIERISLTLNVTASQ